MDKVKVKEVCSANGWYLAYGVLFLILPFLLEFCAIRNFFIKSITEAIALAVVLQFPCLLCFALSCVMLDDWVHRGKFNLYYCELGNDLDIDYIKKNYCIEDINAYGVLFVDKENSSKFSSWKMFQVYDSLYEIEDELFS